MTKKKNQLYSGRAWRNLRPVIFERDGGLCQVQLEGCTKIATQVDHIHPLAFGGAPYDVDNLRASCSWCTSTRANRARRKPSRKW
jgi:5-methylcytosine-specific restriction endonuclease McrA